MSIRKRLSNGLPAVQGFITRYSKHGTAEFAKNRNDTIHWHDVGGIKNYALGNKASTSPVKLSDDGDLQKIDRYLIDKPGMVIHGGAICRSVDFARDIISPMHRGISLDFGVVIDGQME